MRTRILSVAPPPVLLLLTWLLLLMSGNIPAQAQSLEAELQGVSPVELATRSRQLGDAARGAIVFHQRSLACAKCHAVGDDDGAKLGPNLAKLPQDVSDHQIIESVLYPSRVIRQGYESVSVLTVDGNLISALLVEETPQLLVLRDVARDGRQIAIATAEIELVKPNETSIMPAGQINQLGNRQQFYDLIRYLIEIRDGGPQRAAELQPSPSMLVMTIPEYENHLDHAGLIGGWNQESFQRGQAIYQRVCANCHGTHDQPGSLPTSLRFADGNFKNGSDPLSMYRTLTHGFGQMTPQTWMVPAQKYDVIHYIRQAYLKTYNPGQWKPVDTNYLAGLPAGDTFGPEPSDIEAWSAMDYGPSLIHTYEIPGPEPNFAYKGLAVRLDPGPGGIARGQHWMVFDTDTLRVAAGWSARPAAKDANNFIDWQAIQFNGKHGVHPQVVGAVAFQNPSGPGWAKPGTDSFQDDQRVLGRDGRRYGPLPVDWGRFNGLYHHAQHVVASYSVGGTEILELPRLVVAEQETPFLVRTFNIGPRSEAFVLQVAKHPDDQADLARLTDDDPAAVRVGGPSAAEVADQAPLQFDGQTFVQVSDASGLDMTGQDFSIVARIKTDSDGSIFSHSDGGPRWIPDGQAFFIRGGRLVFDIGWVGAVTGKSSVVDGRWHDVALTWQQSSRQVRLYVDGRLDGQGTLAAKAKVADPVLRIGMTSPNFPRPQTFFSGQIADVRFYQQALSSQAIAGGADGSKAGDLPATDAPVPVAAWSLQGNVGAQVVDVSGGGRTGVVRRGASAGVSAAGPLVAGFAPRDLDAQWSVERGNLRLRIPAGDQPLRFSVWVPAEGQPDVSLAPLLLDAAMDLRPLTTGGPLRWPQTLTTTAELGPERGAFSVDVLNAPESNPWLAQTRLTGLDFYPDGRIAVCTWDGDVWIVTPGRLAEGSVEDGPGDALQGDTRQSLTWRRIASGLFQPLGLKIVDDKIHLICRDQLTVLHDFNGDGEIDFYQCLNNDHQVTEHFHEFAMGLQVDAEGNFYYAKSGCHGKAAVVPHHGTLLRVTPDGSRTDILANGFRAANGVCLNPDGSFVVTDQEGFWNPKNRINWVTLSPSGRPKFYGNMLGYHDVTDESDDAMEPPLCWITNDFDRSPAELLWVDSPRWGELNGSLLNLSYGYGKVYKVLHEDVGGTRQGGMIELPLPAFPTGVMRGRFHPVDGQLYLCGMFAWAGNATHPGGLYRIRYLDRPSGLPAELHCSTGTVQIRFSEAIEPALAADLQNYAIEAWDLKRTARYGSPHINQRTWPVTAAKLSPNGKTLTLSVPDIAPTWGMEIVYRLRTVAGQELSGKIHNTIHRLEAGGP